MTLRSNFTGALDAALVSAQQAGSDLILVTNLTTITSAMSGFAASGLKKFTINLVINFQPSDIALKGALWYAYKSGIFAALAAQGIMMNEVEAELNNCDSLTISVDLKFDFAKPIVHNMPVAGLYTKSHYPYSANKC